MSIEASREIGAHLGGQPLGDDLSDDDLALVLFIATHAAQHGYPPSFREIAKVRGIPYSTVLGRIERLARLRVLRWDQGSRRTLRVVR